jgi:hypothetical protein
MDDVVACPHLGTGNRVPADAVGVPCRVIEQGVRKAAE